VRNDLRPYAGTSFPTWSLGSQWRFIVWANLHALALEHGSRVADRGRAVVLAAVERGSQRAL
jgi:hypothetical protein